MDVPFSMTDLKETKGGFSVLFYILARCVEDKDYRALETFRKYIGEILTASEAECAVIDGQTESSKPN